MPGKVVLTVTAGPIKGRVFTFENHDTFIFGRAEDCHARLPEEDPTASRHHFLLEVNAPESRLRDLGSMNGTFVNEKKHGGRAVGESPEEAAKRSSEVDVSHGDVIGVGDTRIEVRVVFACNRCGRSLDEDPVPATRGSPFCRKCSESEPRVAPRPTQRRILCQLCKEDVTREVPEASSGDYVCLGCRSTLPPPPRPTVHVLEPLPPAIASPVAGYEVLKELGKGGMGVVYLAKRTRDGRLVALKVMLAKVAANEYMRQMFLRELEVTSALDHPNVVKIVESGGTGGVFFLAMEFCGGGNLTGLLARKGGRLPVETAVRLVTQAARGLAYAHGRGVIHRDIKPENILLTDPEDGAKLADFGLAKNFELAGLSGFTQTGSKAGTPLFMPREQLTNYKYVKPASDVWAMGATLHFLLTGRNAREFQKGCDALALILQGDIPKIRTREASIPAGLAEVVDRALATDPRDRYADGGAFVKALEKAL
jgi:hypothetical protein